MTKGINVPTYTEPHLEGVMAICQNCNHIWREEILVHGMMANSKSYDFCSDCRPDLFEDQVAKHE